MNTLEKLIGGKGCFMIVGDSEGVIPSGSAAYACIIGIDDTQITTLNHLVSGAVIELTDASWESVALKRGDYIVFENPVVSITLNGASDSIICYLEPTDYIEPEA
jgi:hypothetical protein